MKEVLFIHTKNSGNYKHTVMNIKVPLLVKYKYQYNCTDVAGAYFGERQVYIYEIEESNTLERWTITPDGDKTDPIKFNKTEYVRFVLIYINQ